MRRSVIAEASASEILAAIAATDAPWWLRGALGHAVRPASRRLARRLTAFDDAIATQGLTQAAQQLLAVMGARVTIDGASPRGAALVVMNHPGAYDALATMQALGRDDVLFLARDRRFLHALPNLRAHLAFVGVAGLKQALRHVRAGGVVVQLGAGAIEPDVRFDHDAPALASWPDGSGFLAERAARTGAAIVPAFVAGVHSPRAKRLRIVRWAESRRITTLGPLFQATLPGFRDVDVTIRFGAPLSVEASSHAARTRILRAAVSALRR